MHILISKTSKRIIIFSLMALSLVSNVGNSAEEKVRDPNKPTTIKNPYAKDDKKTFAKPGSTQLGKKPSTINRPLPNIGTRRVKIYKVPGATVIAAAKRHGYHFGVDMKDISRGCRFTGIHWSIPAKSHCGIIGFESKKNKCKSLRKGWIVRKMELTNFDPKNQHTNSYYLPGGNNPLIKLWPKNRNNKTKAINIDYVILEGPSGPFKNFENAFSHCDVPNYR